MLKIRIGIIGSGRMGMRHAGAYKKIPNAEVIGFSDQFPQRSKSLAKSFNTNHFSINDLISNESVDLIHVCTPNESHAKYAISSMKNGKHVLVEKPMALSVSDCKKMITTSKKMNVKLMIGHTFRFYPSSISTKKILTSKIIGTPLTILDYGLFSPGLIPKKQRPSWDKKSRFDTDIILDSIHSIDKLRFWLNSEISSVYTSQIKKIEKSSPFKQLGNITLNFQNGCAATIIVAESPWGMTDNSSKIIGTKGILYVKYGEEVKVCTNSKWKHYKFKFQSSPPSFDHNLQGFVNEFSEFINCIKKNSNPPVSGMDGMKNFSVVMAIYESFKKKRIIKLKY